MVAGKYRGTSIPLLAGGASVRAMKGLANHQTICRDCVNGQRRGWLLHCCPILISLHPACRARPSRGALGATVALNCKPSYGGPSRADVIGCEPLLGCHKPLWAQSLDANGRAARRSQMLGTPLRRCLPAGLLCPINPKNVGQNYYARTLYVLHIHTTPLT